MDLQQEYNEAFAAFYQAKQKADEAKDVARKAFQRMKKEEKGFGQGDVVEYKGVQGVCLGWDYPTELRCDGDVSSYFSCFYPYKRDGSLSTQIRYIYDLKLVKIIKRSTDNEGHE